MNSTELAGVLDFLRATERLKSTTRTGYTSSGQQESVAEHTWRLCLMALVLRSEFPDVDFARLVKICIIHDLGEAIGGDIPAIHQQSDAPKAGQERKDLLMLLAPLPDGIKHEIVALWDEYEAATTPEAQMAKALDKLETLLQHNQGANPPYFDYAFNLEYGRKFTDAVPFAAALRTLIDAETEQKAAQANGDQSHSPEE